MHDVEADWFFGLVGLVAMVQVIQTLKTDRILIPMATGFVFRHRKKNPIGYWLGVLLFGFVALGSLYLVAKDIWHWYSLT